MFLAPLIGAQSAANARLSQAQDRRRQTLHNCPQLRQIKAINQVMA
jgi:hypothetical protein